MLEQLGPGILIKDVQWLPGQKTLIAVLTTQFIKIYDTSKDIISPKYCINIFEGNLSSMAMKEQTSQVI